MGVFIFMSEWRKTCLPDLLQVILQWSTLKNGGLSVPLRPVRRWLIFLSSGRKVTMVCRRKLWLNNDSAHTTALQLCYGVTQNLLENIMPSLSHDNERILYAITPSVASFHYSLFSEASYTMRMVSTPSAFPHRNESEFSSISGLDCFPMTVEQVICSHNSHCLFRFLKTKQVPGITELPLAIVSSANKFIFFKLRKGPRV